MLEGNVLVTPTLVGSSLEGCRTRKTRAFALGAFVLVVVLVRGTEAERG